MIDRRLAGGRAVLAVDVGLHAMFTGPGVEGLEEWPGAVEPHEHDGWSTVEVPPESVLFAGLEDAAFRFAHAYAARRFPLLETWPADTRLDDPSSRGRGTTSRSSPRSRTAPSTALQLRPELSGDAGATVLDPLGRLAEPGEAPMTERLELLPAVDVADGQAVRLTQGAAGTETGYGDPWRPRSTGRRGAEWIHLVDLDAAFGRGTNAALLAEVTAELAGRASRSSCPAASATTPRSSARSRPARPAINLGTAALENPEWAAR